MNSCTSRPLADQPDHRDVAIGPAREHREQHRLADARAGEQAKPLALAERGEEVERANAGVDPAADAGAAGGGRREGAKRSRRGAGAERALAVERAAEAVDDPAEPGVGRVQRRLTGDELGRIARDEAVGRIEGERGDCLAVQGGDFGLDFAGRAGNAQAGADAGRAAEAADFERRALDPAKATEPADRIGRADRGAQRGEALDGAQAASSATSATPASASCSSRISVRQSPSAR
ncbi:hypothetical protein GCM10022281_12370 [Sphingomonas rosea]|uniref:Uncharacterized protein n=1 Tax=Sphingomonas rosea TaxID=335605 RepID=A0ABP7U0U4_9SPHN